VMLKVKPTDVGVELENVGENAAITADVEVVVPIPESPKEY
jgi:hypothetical protein